jgi:uroporphyrinogen-III synthase
LHRTTIQARGATITKPSLNSFRILNPRPVHQAAELSQIIQNAGGVAIEFPMLDIETLPAHWVTSLPTLSQLNKAIFLSANAVHAFFSNIDLHQWPATIQVFAIGQATAQALRQYGLSAIQTPDIADSEHVLAIPALQNITKQAILLVTGEKNRPLLPVTLRERGADLHHIAVYRRVLPKKNPQFAHTLWQDDAVDIILMLSQDMMENLFVLFEEEARVWLQSKPWIVISPRLVKIAHMYQVRTVMCTPYSEMLTTLKRLMEKHGRKR